MGSVWLTKRLCIIKGSERRFLKLNEKQISSRQMLKNPNEWLVNVNKILRQSLNQTIPREFMIFAKKKRIQLFATESRKITPNMQKILDEYLLFFLNKN